MLRDRRIVLCSQTLISSSSIFKWSLPTPLGWVWPRETKAYSGYTVWTAHLMLLQLHHFHKADLELSRFLFLAVQRTQQLLHLLTKTIQFRLEPGEAEESDNNITSSNTNNNININNTTTSTWEQTNYNININNNNMNNNR